MSDIEVQLEYEFDEIRVKKYFSFQDYISLHDFHLELQSKIDGYSGNNYFFEIDGKTWGSLDKQFGTVDHSAKSTKISHLILPL